MTPLRLNRRRFLGCSAAAGLSLAGAPSVEAGSGESEKVRLGLVGVGNRGTAILRSLLSLPHVEIVAVADLEPKHRSRAQGITEKAGRPRPEEHEEPAALINRPDIHAIVVALPCDLHAQINLAAIRSGKHLYAEKPLALTVSECDTILLESKLAPDLVVHVGHQRRSNPRFISGAEALRSGRFGELVEARASWTSSNGPMRGHEGWLGSRVRSGDWMIEQAVHVWDSLHWLSGSLPIRASGAGRTGLFSATDPTRDVTDWYSAQLEWANGFHASMTQSWIDPADDAFTGVSLKVVGTEGGYDFGSGSATFRDRTKPRESWTPGAFDDTSASLAAFIQAIRSGKSVLPPMQISEARDAVVTGLMVRKAVDEKRGIWRSEVDPSFRVETTTNGCG